MADQFAERFWGIPSTFATPQDFFPGAVDPDEDRLRMLYGDAPRNRPTPQGSISPQMMAIANMTGDPMGTIELAKKLHAEQDRDAAMDELTKLDPKAADYQEKYLDLTNRHRYGALDPQFQHFANQKILTAKDAVSRGYDDTIAEMFQKIAAIPSDTTPEARLKAEREIYGDLPKEAFKDQRVMPLFQRHQDKMESFLERQSKDKDLEARKTKDAETSDAIGEIYKQIAGIDQSLPEDERINMEGKIYADAPKEVLKVIFPHVQQHQMKLSAIADKRARDSAIEEQKKASIEAREADQDERRRLYAANLGIPEDKILGEDDKVDFSLLNASIREARDNAPVALSTAQQERLDDLQRRLYKKPDDSELRDAYKEATGKALSEDTWHSSRDKNQWTDATKYYHKKAQDEYNLEVSILHGKKMKAGGASSSAGGSPSAGSSGGSQSTDLALDDKGRMSVPGFKPLPDDQSKPIPTDPYAAVSQEASKIDVDKKSAAKAALDGDMKKWEDVKSGLMNQFKEAYIKDPVELTGAKFGRALGSLVERDPNIEVRLPGDRRNQVAFVDSTGREVFWNEVVDALSQDPRAQAMIQGSVRGTSGGNKVSVTPQ